MRRSTLSSGLHVLNRWRPLDRGARVAVCLGLGVALLASCEVQSPLVPSDEFDAPSTPSVFTIVDSTVTPTALVITVGERVVFVNADQVDHDMASDQHPTHLDCPAINQAGYLRPSESRETGNFVRVETCEFHDHLNAGSASLTGRIIVVE